MINVEEHLKSCSDQELYNLIIKTAPEVKRRLINLLKEHNCTSVYIPRDEDQYASVNDMYGTHGWDKDTQEKDIRITEVGFANVFDEDTVFNDNLYVLNERDEMYSGDEINEDCLWDIYHYVREMFKEVKA